MLRVAKHRYKERFLAPKSDITPTQEREALIIAQETRCQDSLCITIHRQEPPGGEA